MGRKILDEKIVTIPEVKDILEKLMEQIGEEYFDTFQLSTLEFAKRFAKVDVKKVEPIRKMLINDYGLDEHYSTIIFNIMPQTMNELRIILEKHPKFGKFDNATLSEMLLKVHDLAK